MRFGFSRQVWQDILGFDAALGPAMRIIGPLAALILLIGGWFITKDWWLQSVTFLRLYALGATSFLVLSCYLVSVAIRSRRPILDVGDLRPDEDQARINCFLQLKVENLGPGTVRPIAHIAYLRDGNGNRLPIATAYLGQEIHWRYFTETERHKFLGQGDEAYAGVFWLRDLDTEAPYIWLYPITLKPEPLWTKPINLEDQTGLRVKIKVTFTAKGLTDRQTRTIKRSYIITPDSSHSLRYKATRVRIRSRFWKD